MSDPLDPPSTEQIVLGRAELPRLRLIVVAGPDRGRAMSLGKGRYKVGKAPTCELVLTDPSVSSQHLELDVEPDRVVVRDLDSTNGSYLAGARFREIELARGTALGIGKTTLRLEAVDAATGMPPSPRAALGRMIAVSEVMRRVFTLIERVAPTSATVLIEGETGTGKELVARAVHDTSTRASGPFVVCDLASLSESLADSELFGHVRGAFTGAERDRVGAFEAARGGTIFLDEIGELPLAVQPRLLRALEQKAIRRIGETTYRDVDVRVVAATNRDLAGEVRAGRFREDLYHRLGIVTVRLPALRERPDDVPLLVGRFLAAAAASADRPPPAIDDATMAALAAHEWPGNVRELRNVVERAVAIGASLGGAVDADLLGVSTRAAPGGAAPKAVFDPGVPFAEAKGALVDAWERDYVVQLLAACDGNVTLAARRAGMDRAYLHRLIKKHELA